MIFSQVSLLKSKSSLCDIAKIDIGKTSLNDMECNKDEAKRAMNIAEKKLSDNDYVGAKKFVDKAQNLYPQLDGLKQVLVMVDVYISGVGEADWYGVLGVDPLADDEALKRQYKKLALLLHPDKNKFKGAEGAFKLVSQAWCLLSDKVKRIAYDQKRKLNPGTQKPPNNHKPASSKGNQNEKQGVPPSAKARSNHQQQQQWSAQNTSGGTYYSSSSGSFHRNRSVSVKQELEILKRLLEELEEALDALERVLKKMRTDVR